MARPTGSMSSHGGTAGIRWWAAAGAIALVVAGTNVFVLPVSVVGVLAVGSGIRSVGRDLEAALLRLGVALLVAVAAAMVNLASGDPTLAAASAASLGCLFVAWRRCDRVKGDRRRAWALHQKVVLARQQELTQRREVLRNRPPGHRM